MALRVLFFAGIREKLGTARCELAFSDESGDVLGLVGRLAREIDPLCKDILLAENTICAVNREVVSREHPLRDEDEVAFFPPVTGG